MENRGHHPYSPSSLPARTISPCFAVRDETNEAAERGTLQHAATEAAEDDPRLSDEEAAAVAWALEYAESQKNGIEALGFTVNAIREQYLAVDDETVRDRAGRLWEGTTGGFPDLCYYWQVGGSGEYQGMVIDWKFGRYAVTPARINKQGQAYWLGLRRFIRKLGGFLSTCKVTFCSPHRGDPPNSWVFEAEEADNALVDICLTVAEAQRRDREIGDAPHLAKWTLFSPASNTCRFCARLGDCPKAAHLIAQQLALADPKRFPAELEDPNAFRALTDPRKIAIGLQLADLAKSWAEAYRRRRTFQAIDNGVIPEGYRLVSSTPRRIKDPAKVMDYAKRILTPEELLKVVDIKMTPLDRAIADRAPRGQKGNAVEESTAALLADGAIEISDTPVVSLRMK